MKQLFSISGQQAIHDGDPWEKGSLQGEPILAQLSAWGQFPNRITESWRSLVHNGHNELRCQRSEAEAAKVSEICGEEYWIRRELWRKRTPGSVWGVSHLFVVMAWTVYVQNETTWGLPDSADKDFNLGVLNKLKENMWEESDSEVEETFEKTDKDFPNLMKNTSLWNPGC